MNLHGSLTSWLQGPRCFNHKLWAGCFLLLAAGRLQAQTQWTVDDSGGADFTSLQVAIDTVSPGDVLLIKSGNYGNVVLEKRLRLLGEPPEPTGTLPKLQSLDIRTASAFTLAHLDISRLRVVDASNRSEIDRCVLGGGFGWGTAGGWPAGASPVLVHGAGDLLIGRTQVVQPSTATETGYVGLLIESASTVQLVQSTVRGGNANANTIDWFSGWGGTGLEVRESSRVWLVDSSITGGDGQKLNIPLGPMENGVGGTGLVQKSGAVVDGRGTPNHQIRGGHPEVGSPLLGPATQCQGSQLLLHSGGMALNGQVPTASQGPCLQLNPSIPPRLILQGPSSPGSAVSAHVFGDTAPGGLPVVLLASTAASLIELPTILSGTPVFLDLAKEVYTGIATITSSASPANFPFILPTNPATAGLRLYLQAAQFTGLTWNGSNLQSVVLTW